MHLTCPTPLKEQYWASSCLVKAAESWEGRDGGGDGLTKGSETGDPVRWAKPMDDGINDADVTLKS